MKLMIGDVFRMQAVPEMLGIIQHARKGEYFLNILTVDLSEHLINSRLWRPVLCGITLDAKFFCGDWVVIGQSLRLASIMPSPAFKLSRNNKHVYEEFSTDLIDENEMKRSNAIPVPRVTVAPVRFEKAALAILRREDWADSYDKILYKNYFKNSDIRFELDLT